jgi:hypothetical protein
MTILAGDPSLGDILLMTIEHTLICLAVVAAVFNVGSAIKRPLVRAWRGSRLRAWWQCQPLTSKATATCTGGFIGNALVTLFCAPLLNVPRGSGVKPMALPLLFIIIGAATFASCRLTMRDPNRPAGPRLAIAIGCILCLTPVPAGVVLMHFFAAMRDLSFD